MEMIYSVLKVTFSRERLGSAMMERGGGSADGVVVVAVLVEIVVYVGLSLCLGWIARVGMRASVDFRSEQVKQRRRSTLLELRRGVNMLVGRGARKISILQDDGLGVRT
jgi:hypothetical protein